MAGHEVGGETRIRLQGPEDHVKKCRLYAKCTEKSWKSFKKVSDNLDARCILKNHCYTHEYS